MSSFWSATDKIPVKQTKVSIPAENGLDFNSNGKINIHVPPSVAYFQPKESFLSFDYLIEKKGGIKTRLQLDAELGGQVLIRDIRIFSGGAGAVLLEEIQNYNVITAVRYDYESDQTLRNKRCLTEAATTWSNNTRNTRGNQRTDLANVTHNPNSAPYPGGTAASSIANTDTTGEPRKVKCLLPLHTGIFQNDKVFPSLLTEGLRLEILLEDAPRCLRVNDMVNTARHLQHACLFHSATTTGGGDWVQDGGGIDGQMTTHGAIKNGRTITDIWVRRDNNQIGLENFPLRIGETFTIIKNKVNPVDDAGDHMRGGKFDKKLIVSTLDWVVAGDSINPGGNWGLVKIGLANAPVTFATLVAGDIIEGSQGEFSIVSTDIAGLGGPVDTANVTEKMNIKVSDVELILQQLEMPAGYTRKMMSMMKAGGTLNYDFLSSTNYKYSQLAGDVVSNIRLPLSQSRAKAILSVPTDASVYSQPQQIMGYASGAFEGTGANEGKFPTPYDASKFTYQIRPVNLKVRDSTGAVETVGDYTEVNEYSVRSGIEGIWDHMTDYQWFYDGKLNPSRRVEVSKIANKRSIAQQPLIELEKALAMSGIRPLSFRKFNQNAVIGRALALQNGAYDTRGRDFNLQCNYQETDAPVKNKLWNNFVFHIRRLSVKGNQISLSV